MADTEPKTAKHKAKAPVPRMSCCVFELLELEFMDAPQVFIVVCGRCTGCDLGHTFKRHARRGSTGRARCRPRERGRLIPGRPQMRAGGSTTDSGPPPGRPQ